MDRGQVGMCRKNMGGESGTDVVVPVGLVHVGAEHWTPSGKHGFRLVIRNVERP